MGKNKTQSKMDKGPPEDAEKKASDGKKEDSLVVSSRTACLEPCAGNSDAAVITMREDFLDQCNNQPGEVSGSNEDTDMSKKNTAVVSEVPTPASATVVDVATGEVTNCDTDPTKCGLVQKVITLTKSHPILALMCVAGLVLGGVYTNKRLRPVRVKEEAMTKE